ncbi:hypothetical protein EA772_01925 [Pedobacter sp. G11]|uniref:hypothetical protein n=1 Tax=Pedobacter sp. G11 TaxID=2482728 RepID=UPI000F5E3CCE|nr:hypothetical protein [Pedobacter sp. G11]AZI24163.1 hypothetical protein EA772_01925 [Pedobacter sp. G11]
MDTINWDELYLQLFAYTDSLLKANTWFRKGKIDSFLEGKQVHDYVSAAIEKFLSEPYKYDPAKRSLVGYLKVHIIRSLVSNDVNKAENKTTSDLDFINNDEDGDELNIMEALLPYVDAYFDQQIDHDKILNDIKEEIKSDEIVKKIFEAHCQNGLLRREILMEYNMDANAFDNGMKRLKTVLKKTAKKYDLRQQI